MTTPIKVSPSGVVARVAADRLAEESKSSLPFLQDDAFVTAERVRIGAIFVELCSSPERAQCGGVILHVGENVS